MRDAAGEAKTNSHMAFFYGPQHMNVSELADQ